MRAFWLELNKGSPTSPAPYLRADGTTETVLRIHIDELRSTGLSFMPEGLEKQLDVPAMADLLAYLNSIK